MTLTAIDRQGPQGPGGRVRSAPRRYQISFARSAPADEPLGTTDLRRPAQLRTMNHAILRHWGLQPCVDEADLVLTELATNALQHGGEDITVTWTTEGAYLVIRVRDGSPVRPTCRAATEVSERGRGLCIVAALAATWGISDDGTTVHCALALPTEMSA